MTRSHPAHPSRAGMYFAFFGGAVAWTIHLIGAYLIAEFACVAGADEATLYGVTWVAWSLLAFSASLLAVALIATLAGWRAREQLRGADHSGPDSGEGTGERIDVETHFARSGAIMSGLFALVIACQTVPIFYFLGSC